jgi:hypothetical protein
LLLLLTGCATTDAELSWRGATYEELVAAWGAPSRSARDTQTWISADEAPQAQRSGSGGAGGAIFSGSPTEKVAHCERTMVFRDGRVADARWSGDRAFCKTFKR